MKSGSWSSFQSALPVEARAGGEQDDDDDRACDCRHRDARTCLEILIAHYAVEGFSLQPEEKCNCKCHTLPDEDESDVCSICGACRMDGCHCHEDMLGFPENCPSD